MDDVRILARHFIKLLNAQLGKNIKEISPEVMRAFLKYSWPGNVRQLKNCIEGAMNAVTERDEILLPHHLPQYLKFHTHQNKYTLKAQRGYSRSMDIFSEIEQREKEKIIEALSKTNGNITKAASLLGLSRQNLQYRIKKYGLRS